MKRILSLVLFVVMLISVLSGLALAAETPIVLWEEKFDAKKVDDLAGTAKDGYTIKERAAGNNMAVIDKEFKDAASFNSYQYASYSFNAAKTGGKASFEYEYKPDAAANNALCVYLFGEDADDAGVKNAPFPYITTVLTATELKCQLTATGSPISLGGAKDFVKIKYEIDLDAHTYDVYVNGTKKGTAWPFREVALMGSAYSAPSPINGGVTLKNAIIMNPGATGDGPFVAKYAFDNFVYSAIDGKGAGTNSGTGTTTPAAPAATAKPVTSTTPAADIGKVVLEETFDKATVGEYKENATAPLEGCTAQIKDNAGDKYLYVEDASDKGMHGYYKKIEAQQDTFTISFDYKIEEGSKGGAAFYMYDSASAWPAAQSIFLNSVIGGFNGPTQVPTSAKIAPNTWVKITSIVNPKSGSFTLYADGAVAAQDYKFRNAAATKIDAFGITGDTSTVPTKFSLNNLVIKKGAIVPVGAATTQPTTPIVGGAGTAEIILNSFDTAEAELKSKFGNSVALLVDVPMARLGSKYAMIDSANAEVRPFVLNDRTLVPVRFIAEAFGAKVDFEESTGKITATVGATKVEMTLGSDIMKINGTEKKLDVAANTYNDRTFIPLRAMVEAVGKQVFWDDRGLIIISDGAAITATDETLIQYIIAKIKDETAVQVGGRYSDVYMTSRWYRVDGRDGQWGSLDAMKRFMATAEKWAYITEPAQIKSITDLGLTFQIGMNSNFGTPGVTEAKLFDGSIAQAPWMPWTHIWSCSNNPGYYDFLKNYATKAIDNGVTQFQFDDWANLVSASTWGGCFCDHCMAGFTTFLKENYTADDFVKWGITDINTFNYKAFLTEKHGVTTNAQYLGKRHYLPIDKVFAEFLLQSTRNLHIKLKTYMNDYAGRHLLYTHNTNYANSILNRNNTFVYDVLDGAMGETNAGAMALDNIVTTSALTKAINKPFVISPLPENDRAMEVIRNTIAATYATGQFMLVPWDAWLVGSTRYFAKTEELEGLYWFVRQYPELFDNYESPASVGVLFNMNKTTAAIVKNTSFDLFKRGIPFKDVVTQKGIPNFDITEKNMQNVEVLMEASALAEVAANEQEIVKNSGVKMVGMDSIDAIEKDYWAVKLSTPIKNVNVTLRAKTDANAPKVVHVLNSSGAAVENVNVLVSQKYLFGGEALTATLYAPGTDPIVLDTKLDGGNLSISIPTLGRWGVIKIAKNGASLNEKFAFIGGFSGMNIGSRPSEDMAVQSGNDFVFTARGKGLNVSTVADTTGNQDQASFAYKNIKAGALRSYSVSAKTADAEGMAGVMMREEPTSNAKYVALTYQADKGLRIAYRAEINKPVQYVVIGKDKPMYMKLVRNSDKTIAYTSADGQTYAPVGEAPITLGSALCGAVAASPTANLTQVAISDVQVQLGDYAATEGIKSIEIKNAKQLFLGKEYALDAAITVSSGKIVTAKDVDVSLVSSDANVLSVSSNGALKPLAEGKATITMKASIGSSTAESKVEFTISKPEPVVFRENFDSYSVGEVPKEMTSNNTANKIAPEGSGKKLVITSAVDGQTSDIKLHLPEQSKKVALEFDFKANFGNKETDTGARVAYVGQMSLSLTASKAGFSYFYGTEQKQVAPIEQNKWYKIKIVMDYETYVADVYIDGQKVVDQGIFRTAGLGDALQLGGWRVNPDVFYEWDNITLSNVE